MGQVPITEHRAAPGSRPGFRRFFRLAGRVPRWFRRLRMGVLDWIAIALLALGLIFFATGLLPEAEADATWDRISPLLLFLATVVVLAELTMAAGLFDMVARRLAIVARGNFVALFGLCVAFAAVTTIGLNLDTTAVLLTPVMLALARALRVPALPIAMCTVWLANTASLLLPVSNLTNLLAANRVALAPTDFAARMWAAQAAALVVTGVALWVFYWRRGQRETNRYELPEPFRPDDRWLLRVTAVACLFFITAILADVPIEVTSSIAACVVLIAFALRGRGKLRWSLIPWRLPVFVTGLFFVVQTISIHLLHPLMSALVSSSAGAAGVFRAAATGAGLANLVNNLPAYLAGEAAVPPGNHTQLLGLLIGVNIGPLITPWASLATLIWYDRCAVSGVRIPLRKFMLTGACVAVAGIALSSAALLWLP
ncbi:MAG: arsenic transporter [Nocardiopsaceae bacterium]|nr:arsenic transporter [Nocardiopsaceae bacterium]